MKNLLNKLGYVSIEIVIIAGIILIAGVVAVMKFTSTGQKATTDTNTKINEALNLSGNAYA